MLAGCSGCVPDWTGWDDVPTAIVTPVSAPEQAAAWRMQVELDAGVWNRELEAVGCPRVFELGAGGHPVRLIAATDWRLPGSVGVAKDDWIEVRSGADGSPRSDLRLLHELGHAIGLSHADAERGPSLMTPKVGARIFERDIAAAACRLGCGPCAPGADPYSIP